MPEREFALRSKVFNWRRIENDGDIVPDSEAFESDTPVTSPEILSHVTP
jgi:hypothetical protein